MSDQNKGPICEPLTDDQRLELAACYAEWCGVDPADRDDWRSEMVVAKRHVREWMNIWAKRARKASKAEKGGEA